MNALKNLSLILLLSLAFAGCSPHKKVAVSPESCDLRP